MLAGMKPRGLERTDRISMTCFRCLQVDKLKVHILHT